MTAAYVYAGVATGGATVSGTNVTMPSGSTLLFNVTITNNAAVGSGLLTATVNTTGAVTDSNLANNTYTRTFSAMAASADVSVTVTDSVSSIVGNANNIYTVQVSNGGVVPVSTNLVHSRSTTGSSTATLGALTCGVKSAGAVCSGTTATIPAGGYVRYATAVLAGAGVGSITYSATASITSGASDPNLGNNSASDTNTVTAGTMDIGITGAIPSLNIITAKVACGVSKPMTLTATRGAGTFSGTADFKVNWSVTPTAPNTTTITSSTCTATSGVCNPTTGSVTGVGAGGVVTYTLNTLTTCPNSASAVGAIVLSGSLSGFNATDSNSANNSVSISNNTRLPLYVKNCGITGLSGSNNQLNQDWYAADWMTRTLTYACPSTQVYYWNDTTHAVASTTTSRCLNGSGYPIKATSIASRAPTIDIGVVCVNATDGGIKGCGIQCTASQGAVRQKMDGTYTWDGAYVYDPTSKPVSSGYLSDPGLTSNFSLCTTPRSAGPHLFYTYWQELSTSSTCTTPGSRTLGNVGVW